MVEWKSKTVNNLYNLSECYDVFDKMHPQDTSIVGYGPFRYRKSRDSKNIALDWAVDVKSDIHTQTAELRVTEDGHTRTMRHHIRESFPASPFLETVAYISGVLEPIAWYVDFDLKQAYDDSPSSNHCISIYRRPRPGDR